MKTPTADTCANTHVQAGLFTNTHASVRLSLAFGRARHWSSVRLSKCHVTKTVFIVFCVGFLLMQISLEVNSVGE